MNANNNDTPNLPYGMLGEDTQSTLDKLEKYTGIVDWTYLKPHFESGALIYVDPCLSITEVGKALSDDDKDRIQAWLKSGDLVKPSELHADWWEQNPQNFTALVVSPFVLMQNAPQDAPSSSNNSI
ncbi:MAG: DUF2288 domain-containing protein [Akkermansiaceae bacterium]